MVVTSALYSCFKTNRYRNDCKEQPYYTLTSSVKQWFPYSGNQTLTFVNTAMQRDTLQLKDFFSGEDYVWNGDECPQTRGQFLRGNIIDLKTNDSIKVTIGYTEQFFAERKTSWINYYDSKQALSQPNAYKRFENAITLNGQVFNNVLLAECAPADNCPTTGITKFYFSKGKGLVAFERNAVLWTVL